jgi:type II secretory pathway pseudopilin PulG
MKAFTLIEVLIVIGILIIVSTFSIPFYQSFQTSSDIRTQADNITQALRRAQLQAQAGQDVSAWGVYFDNAGKKFVFYKGNNYAGRDPDYDLESEYPPIITVSNTFGSDISFALYSGLPSATGTTTLSNTLNETKHIIISGVGLIQNAE